MLTSFAKNVVASSLILGLYFINYWLLAVRLICLNSYCNDLIVRCSLYMTLDVFKNDKPVEQLFIKYLKNYHIFVSG